MEDSTVVAIVAAVIALGSAIASSVQVRVAIRQTKLQQQIREDAAQPYVFVDFRVDPVQAALVEVHLENRGPTVATNVRVSWSPELPEQPEVHHGATVAPRRLPSMPPGRVMTWTLGLGSRILADDSVPSEYVVTIDADGPFGPVPTLTYTLSLADLAHTGVMPQGSLDRVAKAVKDVADAIKPAS